MTGACQACARPLTGRQTMWCSQRCTKTQYERPCVGCGKRLSGRNGNGPDAATMCWPCSVVKTKRWEPVDGGYDTPCHRWLLHLNQNGYGSQWDGKQMRDAHRVEWERVHGPIVQSAAERLVLDHLCRNRWCVNVTHLEVVTHSVNCQRGANAKLTPARVAELKRLIQDGRTDWIALAREFGVTATQVWNIRVGKSWKHVEPASRVQEEAA